MTAEPAPHEIERAARYLIARFGIVRGARMATVCRATLRRAVERPGGTKPKTARLVVRAAYGPTPIRRPPAGPKGTKRGQLLAQVRANLLPHGEPRHGVYGVADDSAYYVPAPVFREICGGFDYRQVARALADVGALRKSRAGGFKHRRALPSGRIIRVYVILAEPLGIAPAPCAADGRAEP